MAAMDTDYDYDYIVIGGMNMVSLLHTARTVRATTRSCKAHWHPFSRRGLGKSWVFWLLASSPMQTCGKCIPQANRRRLTIGCTLLYACYLSFAIQSCGVRNTRLSWGRCSAVTVFAMYVVALDYAWSLPRDIQVGQEAWHPQRRLPATGPRSPCLTLSSRPHR